jgi:beta-lactamase class A
MSRVILLSSFVALLAVVAGTDLALKIAKPAAAQQVTATAASVGLMDPTAMTRQLQKLRQDGALPRSRQPFCVRLGSEIDIALLAKGFNAF